MTTPCQTPLARKLCTIEEAVDRIGDDQTVAFTGFAGGMHAEALSKAIGSHFVSMGRPRGLTLVHAAGQGDWAERGLQHLAHEGLIRKVIGGHFATCRTIGKLAIDNKIEAYNLPQGVICQLYRDIAAGRPGCITHVGLETFVDPINGGGRLNARSQESLVQRVELEGITWLWYKSFPIHVAIIRAWAADPHGNLVCDREAVLTEVLPAAQAAHNSGGIVIAQVRELMHDPAPPHSVCVPGILVDHIVQSAVEDHPQTFGENYKASFCAAGALGNFDQNQLPPLAMDERRIIAARACDELRPGFIVNLGVGIPEGIAQVAGERQLIDQVTLTVESGVIGGMPAGGLSFGASVNPQAIIDQPAQFDFYDGRGLDFAALGLAQVDATGNVNVSKFGTRLAGAGGFINISQTARRLVFCGAFTTGGLEVCPESGKLRIVKEGCVRKFVRNVEQISFSAKRAQQIHQTVLYVTERAVFRLTELGLELIEIAPGVDLERDILDQMEFTPIMNQVRMMPASTFALIQ